MRRDTVDYIAVAIGLILAILVKAGMAVSF